MPAPLRRRLLATAPAALLLPAPGPALPAAPPPAAEPLPETDARIFALRSAALAALDAHAATHARFASAEAARDRAGQAEALAAGDEHWSDYEDALLDMAELPAAGLVGLAAKMSATLAFADEEGGQNLAEFALLASAAEDAARLLDGLALPDLPERKAASADAELLRLWGRWCDLGERMQTAEEGMRALSGGPGGGHVAPPVQVLVVQQSALAEERRQVLDGIVATPGRTRSGREAKAEILGSYVLGRNDPVSLLAASLVGDLLGGAEA